MNFNSILIGSEDPARLAAYYTKLFGEPGFNEGGFIGWMIGNGAVTVGPHDQVKGTNAEPGRLIWNIESPDVKADFERFKTAGATVVREPYTFEEVPGSWIATFADPDGNYFQLISPMMPG
jgi:predicted enzyme related to lactoylglutathione lyase